MPLHRSAARHLHSESRTSLPAPPGHLVQPCIALSCAWSQRRCACRLQVHSSAWGGIAAIHLGWQRAPIAHTVEPQVHHAGQPRRSGVRHGLTCTLSTTWIHQSVSAPPACRVAWLRCTAKSPCNRAASCPPTSAASTPRTATSMGSHARVCPRSSGW